MAIIYGSSQTNPNYANYQGSQTYAPRSVPQQINTPVNNSYSAPQNYQAPRSGGSVLGASTQSYNPVPQGYNRDQNGTIVQQDVNAGGGQQVDPYAGLRNEISSAWDQYLSSLEGTQGFLNDQQNAQRGIANTQYDAGVNAINSQKATSLRDIANTTRNAFQAGNNYLGSLGAGDSSAANQYSFAINQQAGKQTGDLNNFVNGQMQQLQTQKDTQINQIAQWFAQQQQALKQQVASGQLAKGQDLANLSRGILDQAIQAKNQIEADSRNQYNALVSWASQNSQNIGQLQQNIAQVNSMYHPGQLQLGAGAPGSATTPVYGGGMASTSGKTDIFGRPIA